ncbi:hypothetical protein [Pelagicoccus mobilis]|nr:hypothetical protein [Pelagicoccus mobilis]
MRSHLGNVTKACEETGVSRRTYYNYYKDDTEFRQEIDGLKDEQIDFAVAALWKLIEAGNQQAIFFYLRTQGRDRGWNEKFPVKDSEKEYHVSARELMSEDDFFALVRNIESSRNSRASDS